MTHSYQLLTTPSGEDVEIDLHIADLVLMLWDRGYETHASCQDISGRIWLMFSYGSARRFLALCRPLMNRQREHKHAWKFGAYPTHANDFNISIWFPKEQYEAVCNLVKADKSL